MTEWKAEMRPEWQDCPSCNGCNNYEVEAILTRANEELAKVRAERDAALARVRELTEWRPMETAPRDTTLVVWLHRDGAAVQGKWLRYWSEHPDSPHVPVAWLPLPEPPKEGA